MILVYLSVVTLLERSRPCLTRDAPLTFYLPSYYYFYSTETRWQQKQTDRCQQLDAPFLPERLLYKVSNDRNVGIMERSAPLCEIKGLMGKGFIQGRGTVPAGQ